MNDGILIGGSGGRQVFLNPRYANRHGLVAGATAPARPLPCSAWQKDFLTWAYQFFSLTLKAILRVSARPASHTQKLTIACSR